MSKRTPRTAADLWKSFVRSETLPTRKKGDSEDVLLDAGVEFLGPVKGDPMFQHVKLPKGWKKVATPHTLWFALVDDKNRKRADIFYNPFHREAYIRVVCRYTYTIDWDAYNNQNEVIYVVTDGNRTIYRTPPVAFNGEMECYGALLRARDLAEAWLDMRWLRWRVPSAYWD